jgi:hypothetical protein
MEKKFGKAWQLLLKAPPKPPPLPIRMLKHSDKEWQSWVAAAKLPANCCVVSVRECRVTARQAEFDAEKQAVSRSGGPPQVLKYPIHGTPERWRATAIAVNGFDLSIRLHGRAAGDGVYSVLNDSQTPMGYIRGQGSLLIMQALYRPDLVTQPPGGNPADGNVLVFRNPKHVLPCAIIDFATHESSNDSSSALQAQAQADAKKAELEHKRFVEEVRREEERFRAERLKDARAALSYYEAAVRQIQTDLAALGALPPDQALQELREAFEREKYQYDCNLPIYARKQQLIADLKTHRVTIVTAPTGSGKSTQIPQYMRDHVLRHGDPAQADLQIAVLQPRRVNASALCDRVAEERHCLPGHEVGYTVGRGESNQGEHTRIHFMTHGLFVQRAQDWTAFARQYAAVILDEAHERSVEIDMRCPQISHSELSI